VADELVSSPAVGRAPPPLLRQTGGRGASAPRRRGRGSDLHNLREYLWGDDPRLVHWRSSAKTGTLTVRELEAETTIDTRIALEGTGAGDPRTLEDGLSHATSLALHLLRPRAQVELSGPGTFVPPRQA